VVWCGVVWVRWLWKILEKKNPGTAADSLYTTPHVVSSSHPEGYDAEAAQEAALEDVDA
jgi:hypothetical protein